jgi:hypothetical protein
MPIEWRDLTKRLTKRYLLDKSQGNNTVREGDQRDHSHTSISELQDRVDRETTREEEHITRESHAQARISRFQQSVTGAGITLSQPSKPSDPKHGEDSASLSERRDTQEER